MQELIDIGTHCQVIHKVCFVFSLSILILLSAMQECITFFAARLNRLFRSTIRRRVFVKTVM